MNTIRRYKKAIGGAIAGGLTSFVTAVADNNITSGEWGLIALGILTGAGIVAVAPANQTK